MFSEAAGDDPADSVSELLTLALEKVTGDELTAFAVLPFRFPMLTVVRALIVDRELVPPETDSDATGVRRVESAGLGTGIQMVWSQHHPEQDLTVSMQVYVFADDDHAVLINVEPIHVMGAVAMMPGLSGFIDSMNVTREDGSVFQGTASSYFPQLLQTAPMDAWTATVREEDPDDAA